VQWARQGFAALVQATAGDVHPPLYALLLRAWTAVFGTGEAAVRSLSAVFGVAAVAAVAPLAASLWRDARAGLLAALLLAGSPYHVYYSQEARSYALFVLLTLVSWLALLWWWDGSPRVRVAYVAASTLVLYTHAYGVFVLLAQAVSVLSLERTRRGPAARALFRSLLVVGLLYLPWAAITVRQAVAVQRSYWIDRPGPAELYVAIVQSAGSLPLFLATMPIVGLVAASRRRAPAGAPAPSITRPALLLSAWFLIPHLVPWSASQALTPFYLTRAAIAALPALSLLVVEGLRRLPPRAAAALALALAGGGAATAWTAQGFTSREQWREAVEFLEATAFSGDRVILDAGHGLAGYRHYSTRVDLPVIATSRGLDEPEVAAALAAAAQEGHPVWVLRFQRPADHDAVWRSVGKRWTLRDYRAWRGLMLYRFDPD
jgi:4-amino-4-deoxy-L-arabinose transferase-like glycosyltransferase